MKRRLRSLLIFLAEKLQGRPVPRDVESFRVAGPVEAPDWLPEHQRELCTYLATASGKTLLRRAAAVHANTAVAACQDTLTPAYSAAKAAGFGECLRWFISLSRSSRAHEESGSDKEEQTDTALSGESALRELMSP